MNREPYVFISYAHKDLSEVLPCITAMKQSGINLWYDEGIQAGSEWPEYIAQQVVSCTKFVLFISKAYLESQNCKRELNFAISRKKDILSIFMEDVELSPGMEMQLGTYQAVFKKRYATVSEFHDTLCKEEWFNSCRILDGKNLHVQSADEQKPIVDIPHEKPQAEPIPKTPPVQTYYRDRPIKKRMVAVMLALLLGIMGAHRFYLDKTISAMLCVFFCWTLVPAVFGLIEGIMILTKDDRAFEEKYKCRVK